MKTLAEQVVHADGKSGHGGAPSEAYERESNVWIYRVTAPHCQPSEE